MNTPIKSDGSAFLFTAFIFAVVCLSLAGLAGVTGLAGVIIGFAGKVVFFVGIGGLSLFITDLILEEIT